MNTNAPLTPALSPWRGEGGFSLGACSQGGGPSRTGHDLALGYSSLAPMGLQCEPTHVGCH